VTVACKKACSYTGTVPVLDRDMKLDPRRHYDHPWRVHALAEDFELLDLWEVAIESGGGDRFERFHAMISDNGFEADNAIVRALFAIRTVLGRWFAWDKVEVTRPIPGCTEHSVVERLSEEDRARTRDVPGTPAKLDIGGVSAVYRFEHEALFEITNATIHALLHISWAPEPSAKPRMAVYIKSRGVWSRVYMAMIEPFRMLFVYPALIAHLARTWRKQAAAI
jgi:hypothetical protein